METSEAPAAEAAAQQKNGGESQKKEKKQDDTTSTGPRTPAPADQEQQQQQQQPQQQHASEVTSDTNASEKSDEPLRARAGLGSLLASSSKKSDEPPRARAGLGSFRKGETVTSDSVAGPGGSFGLIAPPPKSSDGGSKAYGTSFAMPQDKVQSKSADRQTLQAPSAAGAGSKKMSLGERLLAKAGFKKGVDTGLGKHGQGPVDFIQVKEKLGRRGLGFMVNGFEPARVQRNMEIVDSVLQEPDWLPEDEVGVPSEEDFRKWLLDQVGPRDKEVAKFEDFCSNGLSQKVADAKEVFDDVPPREFVGARNRCNPFEALKSGPFCSRAGLKLANVDRCFEGLFSGIKNPQNAVVPKTIDFYDEVTVKENERKPLYFGDVCGGPGSFSQYLLFRRRWRATGFGFTLAKKAGGFDFGLDKFGPHAPCDTFHTYYGETGDGDITDSGNIRGYRNYIRHLTPKENDGLLDVVVGDGGFGVSGEENLQEYYSRQLFLCQSTVALSVLRPGGSYMCKLFDMFLDGTIGTIYILWRCFRKVCVFKPHASRPANSERFVVCEGLRPEFSDPDVRARVLDFLLATNDRFNDFGKLQRRKKVAINPTEDVVRIVPASILRSEPFRSYITRRNDEVGNRQVEALRTIRDFVRDRTLQSQDQVALRQLCMQYWNLPIGAPRVALPAPVPQAVLANLQRFLVQKERSLFSATTAGDKARSSALPAHKLPKLLESTSEIGALRRVPTFNLSDAAFVGRVLRSVRVLAAPRRPYAAQYSLCRAAKTPNNSGHQPQWSALCIHHQSHGLLVGRGRGLPSAHLPFEGHVCFRDADVVLPLGTVLEVSFPPIHFPEDSSELVSEFSRYAILVVDALSLGFEVVAHKKRSERARLANAFLEATRKENGWPGLAARDQVPLKNIFITQGLLITQPASSPLADKPSSKASSATSLQSSGGNTLQDFIKAAGTIGEATGVKVDADCASFMSSHKLTKLVGSKLKVELNGFLLVDTIAETKAGGDYFATDVEPECPRLILRFDEDTVESRSTAKPLDQRCTRLLTAFLQAAESNTWGPDEAAVVVFPPSTGTSQQRQGKNVHNGRGGNSSISRLSRGPTAGGTSGDKTRVDNVRDFPTNTTTMGFDRRRSHVHDQRLLHGSSRVERGRDRRHHDDRDNYADRDDGRDHRRNRSTDSRRNRGHDHGHERARDHAHTSSSGYDRKRDRDRGDRRRYESDRRRGHDRDRDRDRDRGRRESHHDTRNRPQDNERVDSRQGLYHSGGSHVGSKRNLSQAAATDQSQAGSGPLNAKVSRR